VATMSMSTAVAAIEPALTESERLALAGFYKYAVEEELLGHSPAAHVRRPRLDYESHAPRWTATSLARCWLPPGSACPPSMP
jgi:hypothetical protein